MEKRFVLIISRLPGKQLRNYGLPLAYYVDEHSIFRFVKHKGIHVSYTVGENEGKIQFKRALETLEIGVIYAQSPEAKGKIERQFDYFQRRLPFLCENEKKLREKLDRIQFPYQYRI